MTANNVNQSSKRHELPYEGNFTQLSVGVNIPFNQRHGIFINGLFRYAILKTDEEGVRAITVFQVSPELGYEFYLKREVISSQLFAGMGLALFNSKDVFGGVGQSGEEYVVSLNNQAGMMFFGGAGLSFYQGVLNLFAGYQIFETSVHYEYRTMGNSEYSDLKRQVNPDGPFFGISFDVPKALFRERVQERREKVLDRTLKK